MKFEVRLTDEAAADLRRLFNHLVDQAAGDWRPAEEALEALIEIGRGGTVTVAAVRHQREGDYR